MLLSYFPIGDELVENNNELELVFLGTGNAFSMANRYWGSILVNNTILLDASPIIVPHMKLLDKELTKIEYIFITHFHGDHYLGLPFLLLDFAYFESPSNPLTIIGPLGIESRVKQISDLCFSGLMKKLEGKVDLIFYEISTPGEHDISGLDFYSYQMLHGDAQAFGYKFSKGGKTLSYTGDTDLCDEIYQLAEGSDILIIELSNPDKDVPGHMSLQKIKTLQNGIGKNVKIILNHIGPITGGLDQFQNLVFPKDLEVLKF